MSSEKKTFFKNTVILAFGKILTQLTSFLLLPLYTAFVSTEDFGLVDLVTTYAFLAAPILTAHIELAAFRYLVDYRNDKRKTDALQKTVMSFTVIMLLIFAGLAIALKGLINIRLIEYIIGYFVTLVIFNLFQNFARGQGKNLVYSVSSCIYGVTVITTSVITLMVFNLGARGLLASYIISAIIGIIYLVFKLKLFSVVKNTKLTKAERSELKQYLKYSAPMIPGSISWWFLNVSDRTIILIIIGAVANGIYAVANKFSSIFVGLFNIINLALVEHVSVHIKNKEDRSIAELTSMVFKYFTYLCIIMVPAIHILFPYFINSQYNDAVMYVPLLLLGSLFTVGLGLTQNIYVALKNTKQIAKTSIVCAIINIVINLCLIKPLGLYAAAISTCISCLALFAYRCIDIKKSTGQRFSFINYDQILLLALSIVLYYCGSTYILIAFIALLAVYILLRERRSIQTLGRYAHTIVKKISK